MWSNYSLEAFMFELHIGAQALSCPSYIETHAVGYVIIWFIQPKIRVENQVHVDSTLFLSCTMFDCPF